ncbi:MAG: hypothetical protein AB7P20_06050 [Rhizobiaceae bacterium]
MNVDDVMPDPKLLASIRADIESYEAKRMRAAASVRWRVPLFLVVLAVLVYFAAVFLNRLANPFEQWRSAPHVFLYVGGFVLAIFAFFWAMAPARQTQQDFRYRLFPTIFRFIEDFRYQQNEAPASFDRLPREMVGSFNRETFDDVITGRYRGFPFELFEARLAEKAGKSENVTFKGVGLAFEAASPFPGILVAGRQAGMVGGFFRNLFGGSLEEIQSGVADLDNAYDFRTDNPDAAKPLIVGRLAQALKWLGETWPSGQALVALRGSDAFLLLPLEKDYFELPAISTPLSYDEHVRPMIADLVTLLETAALVRQVGGGAQSK